MDSLCLPFARRRSKVFRPFCTRERIVSQSNKKEKSEPKKAPPPQPTHPGCQSVQEAIRTFPPHFGGLIGSLHQPHGPTPRGGHPLIPPRCLRCVPLLIFHLFLLHLLHLLFPPAHALPPLQPTLQGRNRTRRTPGVKLGHGSPHPPRHQHASQSPHPSFLFSFFSNSIPPLLLGLGGSGFLFGTLNIILGALLGCFGGSRLALLD